MTDSDQDDELRKIRRNMDCVMSDKHKRNCGVCGCDHFPEWNSHAIDWAFSLLEKLIAANDRVAELWAHTAAYRGTGMTDPSQLDAARAQIIELEERREDAVQKYVKYLGLYTETAAECDNLRTALVDLIGAIDNDGRSVLVPTTTRELAGEELMKECTCVKCGWVHMAYTRKQAQDEVNRFNAAYEKMSPETQALYSGPVAIENYEGCRRCGGRRFREAREDDCPAGVTISPVIWES